MRYKTPSVVVEYTSATWPTIGRSVGQNLPAHMAPIYSITPVHVRTPPAIAPAFCRCGASSLAALNVSV